MLPLWLHLPHLKSPIEEDAILAPNGPASHPGWPGWVALRLGEYQVTHSEHFLAIYLCLQVIDKMKLDQSTRMQMLQEVRLMKLVQHPNVVRLYEVTTFSVLCWCKSYG